MEDVMKKLISFLRSYLGHVGAYFMFTMLVFILFSMAMGLPSDTFNTPLVWTSLLFSALVGVADYVFHVRFLGSYFVKLAIHGILCTVAFGVSFVALSGLVERGKTGLFGILGFLIFYVFLAVVRGIYHTISDRSMSENEPYTNLYTPKNLDK